jgi:hypothetical protein
MATKPAQTTITRDDWLTAIEETHKDQADRDPSLLSYAEFGALMQVCQGTAMRRLNGLVEAGRAIRTTKRMLTPDGRIRSVVAFRLKK